MSSKTSKEYKLIINLYKKRKRKRKRRQRQYKSEEKDKIKTIKWDGSETDNYSHQTKMNFSSQDQIY